MPQTQLTKQKTVSSKGDGQIWMTLPYWYDVGDSTDWPYDAVDGCEFDSSIGGTIISSEFASGTLKMTYYNLPENYWSGETIKISCKGFKNPIEPISVQGYTLTTYDSSEPNPYKIDAAFNVEFDGTALQPVTI